MSSTADAGVLSLPDDGLYTPEIGRHSLEKVRLHNYYATMFSTSMKNQWPQRAYLGLYAGPGRAHVRGLDRIVETTPLGALRTTDPFTKYIFVDHDPQCIDALDRRIDASGVSADVTLIQHDVGKSFPQIEEAMPNFGPEHGLLSFCFIDPFAADLDFAIIKSLGGRYRMDFMILLMLGVDVRQNFRRYFEDPSDTRIGRLIDDPKWREEWRERGLDRKDLIRFVLEKFDRAMVNLGYIPARAEDAHPIRVTGKGVFLYYLIFYSKHELAMSFWRSSRQAASLQLSLGLE